jgi:anti-sigma B factor antagonist
MKMDIQTKIENQIFEILVEGEIDASSSIHLDNAMETAFSDHKKIMVNLEKLDYISSAGLGVFIARLQEIGEKNVQLILFGLNDKVRQVFNILGLEDLLNIVTDRKEAITQFDA